MRIVLMLLGLLVVLVAGAVAYIYSGAYNVAADEPHWGLTKYVMETVRRRSIASRAAHVVVPKLDDESLIQVGAGNYDAMCTGCHLKPGVKSTEQSVGLYPAPPDLTKNRIADPAAAFRTIKHGVKMTGMPAWGRSMEDEYIWGMVAFLQKLPGLSRDRYDALVEASGGHQHGGTESAVPGNDEDAAQEPPEHSHDHDHSNAPPHKH